MSRRAKLGVGELSSAEVARGGTGTASAVVGELFDSVAIDVSGSDSDVAVLVAAADSVAVVVGAAGAVEAGGDSFGRGELAAAGGGGGGVHNGEKAPVADPGFRKNRLSDSNASNLQKIARWVEGIRSPVCTQRGRGPGQRTCRCVAPEIKTSTSIFLAVAANISGSPRGTT